MRAYMETHGLAHSGAHHEIYLSDPMRTAPEKLRTIIRQPVAYKTLRIAASPRTSGK